MTERVLVAAPYPTMGGPESAATFELVQSLARDGNDVVVVSPRPSAAHHHADPGSPRGAVRLASLAGGRQRMVIRLDASALGASSDTPRLLPARLALAGALRRVDRAEVILDRVPDHVARRWVALVLEPATVITVATEPEREALIAGGVRPDFVNVDRGILPPTTDRVLQVLTGPRPATTGLDAAAIETLLRRRAADALTPLDAGAGPGERGIAAKPLRSLPPLERPQIRSNNPGYVGVKKVQLKLLAWMFDWVIQHVNRLHHATIEAVDNLDSAGNADSRRGP